MENTRIAERLTAVINTLNASMLRADQVDAVQRIDACTRELKGIIAELSAEAKPPENKQKS